MIHFTIYVNGAVVKEGDLDDWMRVKIARYLIEHPEYFSSDFHGKIVISVDAAAASFLPHTEIEL